MGLLLKEALKTICVNNRWSYAVFWKIGCQNANLLIWEESYHEYTPTSFSPQISGISSSQRGSEKADMLLVNKMMLNNRIILVGEGLVGRAAFTRNHQWILANSFNRNLHPPEVINEMHLQFSAGIQTVAVVPVTPHGVVQLGSRQPIMENLGFVNDVKGLILQLGCVPGALLSENYSEQEPADLIGVPVSRITPYPALKVMNPSDLVTFNSSEQNHQENDQKVTVSSDLFGEQFRNISSVCPSNPDEWLNQQFSPVFNSGVQQQTLSWPPFQENGSNADTCQEMHSQPSSGSDLFDVLGLDSRNRACDSGWSVSQIDGTDMRTEILTKELSNLLNIQTMGSDIYSGYEFSGTDHLLDAVVSGACSSSKQVSDDNTTESCRTTLTKHSNSSVNATSKNGFYGGLFEIPKTEEKETTLGSSRLVKDHNIGSCSQTGSVYGSQISSWVEQAHSLKRESSVSTAYSKMNKNETLKTTNRKRLKPGENPRPRPKDRQLIQDRVKELREIIPNGAKCSIDALLERTVKHLLFLQNVTKHADKLKQTGESKVHEEMMRKGGFEGGATWAFEVGSESFVCPIVVEDLNTPRCFQVEMLCEERGFFLEIADWIRSLGLTILKGVMEVRNDKIWARFAVEANREVTRMEIFMLLVNILEQSMKCVGPTKNILDRMNGSIAVNAFPQTAATIPVTGGCSM